MFKWMFWTHFIVFMQLYNFNLGHSFLIIFSFTGPTNPKFASFENKIKFLLICHDIYADPFLAHRILKFEIPCC